MIVLLKMKVIDYDGENYTIDIRKRDEQGLTQVRFNPEDKTLSIDVHNDLGVFLKRNEYQFRKLLHNKRPETYAVGFTLAFSIIDQKDIAKFNDKSNIVITEFGNVYTVKSGKQDILEVYTDGSYDELSESGAYGYAVVNKGHICEEVYELSNSKSSSHLELLAVLNFVKRCNENNVRVYTDSQYVRKGITEWIYHWRENGFTTANGTKAKNVDDWILLNNLISEKYIEWVWIKSHRDNLIHNQVDQKVREKAKEKRNII